MEVMHERNAHNFPLDLASAESAQVALTAPSIGNFLPKKHKGSQDPFFMGENNGSIYLTSTYKGLV